MDASLSNSKKRKMATDQNSFVRLESIGEVVENEVGKEHVQQPSSCLLKYDKRGSAGIKGVEFQVRLLTVLLLNARRKLQDWKLSTEDIKAGKFDDAVLEWPGGTFLIQAKHKEKKNRITLEDFLSTNSKNEFSLSKYFFSYYYEIKDKFKENKTLAICTNSGIQDKVLEFLDSQKICPESILYWADKNYSFYMFNMKILPRLKQCVKEYFEKNYKNKNMDKTVISDKNVEDFLKCLHLYSNYSLGNKAEEVIQKLISFFKCFGIILAPISFSEVYSKVMEWFKRENGIYLTEIVTDAMLLEIKSDQYWKKLGGYDVSFKENLLDLQHKRLYYVKAEGGYLLQELKIYQTLKNTRKSKILYANTDSGIELQKKIIEAFQVRFYNVLIISWARDIEEIVMREMFGKLRQISDQFENKKIILVAENNDNLLQYIGLDKNVYDVVNGSVSFKDFSTDFQTVLLKKNVIFQGTDITLQELLETQTNTNKLNSGILEELVRGKQINVGQKIHPLQEELNGYYIDRSFEREIGWREMVSEEEMCDIQDKVILIGDEAGMGKSTVLSHLAFIIKNKKPSKWVIRIQLSDYTEILSEFKEQKKFINITELLHSKNSTSLSNQLEKELFLMDRKIVILIDGVDEISPDYTELVVGLLVECQKGSNFAKVFLTARPHMNLELVSKLQIEPFTLHPFWYHNQISFLTNYWMHNLKLDVTHEEKCQEYAIMLIRTTSSWVGAYDRSRIHFAAIPLLVRMLAEIFQSNDGSEESMHWEGCKEYVFKESEVLPKLPEKSNMTNIYQKFIEKKRDVFKRKGNPSGNTAANKALDDQFENCLAVHRMLALEEILRKSECKLFQDYQPTSSSVETDILKMGIVQRSKNSFHFAHRTLAEYFIAESLISELKRQVHDKNENFQKFFFDEILLKEEFKVVRAFLDNFLKEIVDCLPSNIFESYRSLRYDVDEEASCNLIHSLAKEGCTSILRLLFKCIEFKVKKFYLKYLNISNYLCENTLDILNLLTQKEGVNIIDKLDKTPLICATEGGHLEMMKFLIEQGANLNCDDFENTPLGYAINDVRFDLVKIMVQHGADLKKKDYWGHTILYKTISKNNVKMVEYLLDNTLKCNGRDEMGSIIPYTFAYLGQLNRLKDLFEEGLDVNSRVENEESLIFGAARGGQLDTVKYLVSQGADINATDGQGSTMLHLTVTAPLLISTAELLIELGIKMNIKNSYGSSALHLAIRNMDMIKLLVENGADLKEKDKRGTTSLHIAVEKSTLEAVKFLIERGSDVNTRKNNSETILHSAAKYGQLDIVKYVVTDLGIDVNLTDNYGNTPLHSLGNPFEYSAYSTDLFDVIKLLVDHGANLNISNNNGSTALHTAAMRGHPDIIECFIKLGADVNVHDNDGRTALHIAGELETTKCLVQLGVDVNLKDNKGCTALHLSALYHKRDILKFLLNSNMDNNSVENENQITLPFYSGYARLKYVCGRTTLHFAAEKGDLDTIKFLAQLGVNLNITDDVGKTPLHYAATKGRLEAAQLLHRLGSDLNIKDNRGFCVLHWAAWGRHLDVVKYLAAHNGDVNAVDNEGHTPLHFAVKKGDLDTIKFLAQLGVNVNITDDNGKTPLHYAAKEGQLEAAQLLQRHGSDLNIKDNDGLCGLHWAAWGRHLDVVKYLAAHNGDVNAVDNEGHTPLHFAVKKGDLDTIKFLAQLGVNVNITDDNGKTPLHYAAMEGQLEAAQLLQRHGSDLNIKDNDGLCGLHWAAWGRHLDVVKYLAAHNGDVNAVDNEGRTPLHFAVKKGDLDTIKFLAQLGVNVNITDDNGKTPLHYAAMEGQLEAAQLLQRHGSDLNIKDNDGLCGLHWAAWGRHLDVVKYLAAHNGDVNAVDNEGHTPLHFAVKKGDLDTIKFLAQLGVNVNITDDNGKTPLHYAAMEGQLEAAQLLQRHGSDLNIKDNDGFCVLHWAAVGGHRDLVKLFLECGMCVNVRTDKGRTALHYAAVNGHLDAVKYLVAHNGDVNAADHEGSTPLHFAAGDGYLDTIKFFTQLGVDVNITDDNGKTPLYYAAMKGPLEAAQLLLGLGSDLNIKSNDGSCGLHWAALRGHRDLVKLFLECGMGVNVRTDKGRTALHFAARMGHLDVVKYLVAHNGDVNAADNEGRTPLHLVTFSEYFINNRLSIVKFLVEKGADISSRDSNGDTAEILAERSGNNCLLPYLQPQTF